MKEQDKIYSIEFGPEGCSVNGRKPVPVNMPAAPKKPTEAEKIEESTMALARLINHRRAKEKITITEV